MRPENQKMKKWLSDHGVDAIPKYLPDGSLRRCWRLYNRDQKWSVELAAKLTKLGFVDFDHKPLGPDSGNGGMFQVFVRGHEEFLSA